MNCGSRAFCADVEQGQRHRQFETPPPGAAGVQVEAVVAPFDQGFVGMAGDDELGCRQSSRAGTSAMS